MAEKSAGLAAELALLFEAARDHERATDHYLVAAENAARIFAHHEAVALARRGLALLQMLPDTPERARRELSLQMTLGMQLQVAQGYAAPEAERTYARARVLREQMEEASPLYPVLWGQWMYYVVRAKRGESRDLAERLLRWPRGPRIRPISFRPAWRGRSRPSLSAIRPPRASTWSKGLPCTTPRDTAPTPTSTGRIPESRADPSGRWPSGCSATRTRRSSAASEGIALSRESRHPHTLALAHQYAAILGQYRREGPVVQRSAEAALAIATDHGFSFWRACGLILRGWALAEQGAGTSGIAQLRQGLDAFLATGGGLYRTYFLTLLAEALGREGQIEEGLGVLAEGLALMHQHGRSLPWGRAASPPGRVPAAAGGRRSRVLRGGSLFSPGPHHCPATAGQIAGAAGRDESDPPLPKTRPPHRSPADVSRVLRLVHRRVRYS